MKRERTADGARFHWMKMEIFQARSCAEPWAARGRRAARQTGGIEVADIRVVQIEQVVHVER